MKYDPNEPYEKWVERVRLYEYGLALRRIAKGESPEKVMEDMSRRLMEKMMHPVIKAMLPQPPSMEEIQRSRKAYEEKMRIIGPSADHVIEEKIDRDE